jgi:hypothetical protein
MTRLHCVISNAANAFGSSICIVLLQPSSSSEASSVKSIQTYRSSFWEAVRKNAGTLAHSSASPCHVPANRRQEQLKMPLPSVPCFFGNCAYKLEAVVQLRGHRRRTIPWAAVPRREMQDGYEEREREREAGWKSRKTYRAKALCIGGEKMQIALLGSILHALLSLLRIHFACIL